MEFRDLKSQYVRLRDEIDQKIRGVLEHGQFILGKEVDELEQKLSSYVGVRHCVGCANGTDAISLVLMSWGIQAGDAVFVPDITFVATAGAAAVLGATPIFVDIDSRTFNMLPDKLEEAIRAVQKEGKLRPRVIIPVDLFGLPCEYEKITQIAEKYGLKILEDCAQGFGGSYHGKKLGSFGDAATTSFFPAKPLGCYGDGGAIFTNDSAMDENLRSLRAQGRSKTDKYDNYQVGINSRLDTVQAAILLVKFRELVEYEHEKATKNAAIYTDYLRHIESILTPYIPDGCDSAWAQYTVLLENRGQRDMLIAGLQKKGIPTMIYYPKPLHQQQAFEHCRLYQDCDNSVKVSQTVLSLPFSPYITEKEIQFVTKTIQNILEEKEI